MFHIVGTKRKFCKPWEFLDQNNAFRSIGHTTEPGDRLLFCHIIPNSPSFKCKRKLYRQSQSSQPHVLVLGLRGSSAHSTGLPTVKWAHSSGAFRLYPWDRVPEEALFWEIGQLTFIPLNLFGYSYVTIMVTTTRVLWLLFWVHIWLGSRFTAGSVLRGYSGWLRKPSGVLEIYPWSRVY